MWAASQPWQTCSEQAQNSRSNLQCCVVEKVQAEGGWRKRDTPENPGPVYTVKSTGSFQVPTLTAH